MKNKKKWLSYVTWKELTLEPNPSAQAYELYWLHHFSLLDSIVGRDLYIIFYERES